MKTLPSVKPRPEQLPLILDQAEGVLIISGAAGSGKTTVALLRLRSLVASWYRRVVQRERRPLRVLVMTYNNTLKGYIEELARMQDTPRPRVTIEVTTFYDWHSSRRGKPNLVNSITREAKVRQLGMSLPLDDDFVLEELDYVLGRFLPGSRGAYMNCTRRGRGASPRMAKPMREKFLREVLEPYEAWKAAESRVDFCDLGASLAQQPTDVRYDIVIVDEAQDFEANRVRAVLAHTTKSSAVTFILDRAQQIYPHHFRWNEVGLMITPKQSRRLSRNYRNTRQIAQFAAPLIDGLDLGPEACMPNLKNCERDGPLPTVVVGKMWKQLDYAIEYVNSSVDLDTESVAFLHPKGWFREHKKKLDAAGLAYETLTRRKDWPKTKTNIALSTMHSAKGLEFDHVILVGLSQITTPHGTDEGDGKLEAHRRLLAMAIGRARRGVVVGYKPGEESTLVSFLKAGTYNVVKP